MRAPDPVRRSRPDAAGMTLLEVLVASSILVIGLVSVAALLPAAGTRLAEATLIDRAGTLAANCYADIWNRGVLKADLVSEASRGVILIEPGMESSMFSEAGLPPGLQAVGMPERAFQLPDHIDWVEDELVSGDGMVSAIATVIPLDRATAGTGGGPFRLSIAVFRRTTAVAKLLEVEQVSGSVVVQVQNVVESDRKRYFPACGWVLVVPATTADEDTLPARWLHIASSWSVNGRHFMRFTDHRLAQAMIAAPDSGVPVEASFQAAKVYGFSQLVRVDEWSVVLD